MKKSLKNLWILVLWRRLDTIYLIDYLSLTWFLYASRLARVIFLVRLHVIIVLSYFTWLIVSSARNIA